MEIRKNLELVSVEYESNDQKAVMTFLDKEEKAVRVVNFNRQKYDSLSGKFVDDDEKAGKVDEWCKTYFDTTFDDLDSAIGSFHDVYVYEKFCSLWEAEMVEKFTEDMEGQIYQTVIDDVIVDSVAIKVRYKIEGVPHESKMSFGVYQESLKEWFVDPIKKERQFEKFLKKFGVPVSEAESIIGQPLMIEVKKAMGKYYYGDMKDFPKKKK